MNRSVSSPVLLDVPFRDKDQAKRLGARWDPAMRRWYVPVGLDLVAFRPWLPLEEMTNFTGGMNNPADRPLVTREETEGNIEPNANLEGISLSTLLQGVAHIVNTAFPSSVWTVVEVMEVRARQGHVYLEIAERDDTGRVLAKANAMIWAAVAGRILPSFEQITGVALSPGIKLRTRARPVFKPQYGFSLEIDAIDPTFTLGDLEARKREIRERLQREGLWGLNRQLPVPRDFERIWVFAPLGAAGLGDFQAESKRLEEHGVCSFRFFTCRFQGEGAASEIVRTWDMAFAGVLPADREFLQSELMEALPDVVAIIRGGGAVNDLAWLNDYDLVRRLCEAPVPVFTGIGHERDCCLLDEVAHTAFDTPSKVVLGIAHRIREHTESARQAFAGIASTALRHLQGVRSTVEFSRSMVVERAQQVLVDARHRSDDRVGFVRQASLAHLDRVRREATAAFREVIGQGPEKTLRRGFALTRNEQAGKIVMRAADAQVGEQLVLAFQDGQLAVEVKERRIDERSDEF